MFGGCINLRSMQRKLYNPQAKPKLLAFERLQGKFISIYANAGMVILVKSKSIM